MDFWESLCILCRHCFQKEANACQALGQLTKNPPIPREDTYPTEDYFGLPLEQHPFPFGVPECSGVAKIASGPLISRVRRFLLENHPEEDHLQSMRRLWPHLT